MPECVLVSPDTPDTEEDARDETEEIEDWFVWTVAVRCFSAKHRDDMASVLAQAIGENRVMVNLQS